MLKERHWAFESASQVASAANWAWIDSSGARSASRTTSTKAQYSIPWYVPLCGHGDIATLECLETVAGERPPAAAADPTVGVGHPLHGQGDRLDHEGGIGGARTLAAGPDALDLGEIHLGDERDRVPRPDLVFDDRAVGLEDAVLGLEPIAHVRCS